MNPAVLSGETSFAITFLASFLIWLMFFGLMVLWIIDGRKKKEQALHAFFSSVFAWLISHMIKGLFPTVRPFEAHGTMPMTVTLPFDGAFPSGHAAVAFALAISVWLHNKKFGTLFIILAVGVSIGRVLGNVHYWMDVVAGAVLGIIIAYLVERLHLYKLLK